MSKVLPDVCMKEEVVVKEEKEVFYKVTEMEVLDKVAEKGVEDKVSKKRGKAKERCGQLLFHCLSSFSFFFCSQLFTLLFISPFP